MKNKLITLSKWLRSNGFVRESKQAYNIINKFAQEVSPLSMASLSLTKDRVVPLFTRYSKDGHSEAHGDPWYCDGEAGPSCDEEMLREGGFSSEDECFRAGEEICREDHIKYLEFKKGERPFVDDVSRDIINHWSGFGGPDLREGRIDEDEDPYVEVYKISSSPEYFSTSYVAHIYRKGTPEESAGKAFDVKGMLEVAINRVIEYLNQERTRYAFRSRNNRDISANDLMSAFKKIRYIVLDPRALNAGGESWASSGVIYLSYSVSQESLYDTLWHELIVHALNGLTPRDVDAINASLEDSGESLSGAAAVAASAFGGDINLTEEGEEHAQSQAESAETGADVFENVNIPKFKMVSHEGMASKVYAAAARAVDGEIEDYRDNFNQENSHLNDDQLTLRWNNEGVAHVRSLRQRQEGHRDKHLGMTDYRARERFEQAEGWEGELEDRSTYTYEERRAFEDEFGGESVRDASYDLFLSIFGEGHHLEEVMFKEVRKYRYLDGRPGQIKVTVKMSHPLMRANLEIISREIVLDLDGFEHLMDEAHRLGALRVLYYALSRETGSFPIKEADIRRAINLRMPNHFYRNNPDLFRSLFLMEPDANTIKRIYDSQFEIVKSDRNTGAVTV